MLKARELASRHINNGMSVSIDNTPIGEAMLDRVVNAMKEYAEGKCKEQIKLCDEWLDEGFFVTDAPKPKFD